MDTLLHRDIAQLDRASAFKAEGSRFDSGYHFTSSRLMAQDQRLYRLNLSKVARHKVVRLLGESPNVLKQVEFFRSHRNFSGFPYGQQF